MKLVVESPLNGVSNGDSMADLRARLDLLPADLEDLYRHLLIRIEPFYLRRASEVFQMAPCAHHIKNPKLNEGSEAAVRKVADSWASENLSSMCDLTRQRLQTWCAGLVGGTHRHLQ